MTIGLRLIAIGLACIPCPAAAVPQQPQQPKQQLLNEWRNWQNAAFLQPQPLREAAAALLEKPRAAKGGEDERDGGEKIEMEKWPLWLQWASYGGAAMILLTCLGWILCVCCSLHASYRVVRDDFKDDAENSTFKSYLVYRFAYWFVWTGGANGIVILLLVFAALILGATAYCFLMATNMFSALWVTFVWLLAPDAGAAETTYLGSVVGALMSICGLVLFALLLTLMQDSFGNYLDEIKNGRSTVLESDHMLLIGVTDSTLPVVQELCKAYEAAGGTTIVVLSSVLSKPDMEERITEMDFDMLGSRIVVRAGLSHADADLRMVSADTARSIVIMADRDQPREMRDAFVLRALIGLRGKGWPVHGKILAVCSLLRNKPLLEQTGGSKTEVVMPDSFVGKLMVQCSKHQGLGAIVMATFGFDGSEFYITEVPERLVGKSVAEASLHFPSAIICGTVASRGDGQLVPGGGRCNLSLGADHRLKVDEALILLATDSACIEAEEEPCDAPQIAHLVRPSMSSMSSPRQERKPERVLMMGWNDKAGNMLLELDNIVPPKTEVILVSPKSAEERQDELEIAQKRFSRRLRNITTRQITGLLGSRFMLEELPDNAVKEASRIFILADDSSDSSADADTLTMAVLLQLRDILLDAKAAQGAKLQVAIVPEIMDTESEMHCQMVQASDFIDTSGLPSKVLAMIAYNPLIAGLLDELLSEEGSSNFAIRHLQDYIQPGTEPPSSISFFQVQELAMNAGDVVIGWSIPDAEDQKKTDDFVREMQRQSTCSGRVGSWEINPTDKVKERAWNASHDKLVVLGSKHF